MNNEESIISIDELCKKFDKLQLFKGISFNVKRGETFTIIGPSGCGKTTLLKMIAGIYQYDSGKVFLFNKDIGEMKSKEKYWINKKIGFLFQNYALLDSLSIMDNIVFYLYHHTKLEKKKIIENALYLLSLVGLENIENKYPSELSGGMKKRVGLIRAIIHKPEILFLDEPVAGLDPVSADTITQIIKSIKQKYNLTLLIISNELQFTKRISDKVGIIYNGKLYYSDDSNKFFNSQDLLIRQFITGSKTGPIKY